MFCLNNTFVLFSTFGWESAKVLDVDRQSTPLFLSYIGAGLGYILPMTFLPTLAKERLPADSLWSKNVWVLTAIACFSFQCGIGSVIVSATAKHLFIAISFKEWGLLRYWPCLMLRGARLCRWYWWRLFGIGDVYAAFSASFSTSSRASPIGCTYFALCRIPALWPLAGQALD